MTEEAIFAQAAAIDSPAERTRFLDEVCAANAELRTAVDRLLQLHESAGSFLEKPPLEASVAATLLQAEGSTCDDDVKPSGQPEGDNPMPPNDEIPLGYLQQSSKPGSLGRLGHYEILEVIGRGAFGTVLRAFDEKLQRVVAIKVLAPEMAATSPARKRFLREARTSAAIRHENVVSIHAVEDEPIPYLVMEYIPGQTLEQRLNEHGPLDLPDVLRLGKQIADGLASAHAQGLIHRDIKPGNILLEEGVTERVKITDFGLARTADDASMTQSGLIAGTPMYMAPEQALGQKLDQRADLFSLGSVLYQMLSGRPPFRAATTLAVLKRVVEDTPRPIPEIIPEAPAWLCRFISHLHAKQPEDRYQSAQEAAELLGRCLDDLQAGRQPTIPSPNSSTAPNDRTPPKPGRGAPDRADRAGHFRNRPWAKVAAAALLLLVGLTITEATGVTRLAATVIRLATDSGTLVIEPAASAAVGPDTTTRPADAADAGWVSLFNGRDLTGWKTLSELPGKWEVKDGILTGSAKPSYLFSERGDLANFHLRAEIRFNGLGDAGLWFRVPYAFRHGPQAWMVEPATGYEAELNDRPKPMGSIWQVFGEASTQVLAVAATTTDHPIGEWCTLEVIADSNHLITKVNGHEAVNLRDKFNRFSVGHLALSVARPETVLEVRRIEIRELPTTSAPPPTAHEFASGEWIDVLPLIDPQLDKWDMRLTGKNEWRIEQGELVAVADEKPSKLLLPLDADDWRSVECELDVTRRSGELGFNFNIPAGIGDTSLGFDRHDNPGINLYVRQQGPTSLSDTRQIETSKRTTLRIEVRSTAEGDRITVWNNDVQVGTWTGDRRRLMSINNEGYPHSRRLSLWVHGEGCEYVFHRIRVRTLDGETATALRQLPADSAVPPAADATQPANALTR